MLNKKIEQPGTAGFSGQGIFAVAEQYQGRMVSVIGNLIKVDKLKMRRKSGGVAPGGLGRTGITGVSRRVSI